MGGSQKYLLENQIAHLARTLPSLSKKSGQLVKMKFHKQMKAED